MKIASIQAREGQPIAIACKGSLGRSHAGPGSCGDEVVESVVCDVPGDASSLVTDPDADIVFPLGKQHLNFWKLFRLAVRFNCRSHRVLEKLKEDVVEVGRGVAEGEANLFAFLIPCHCLTFYFYVRSTVVIFLTEKGGILKSVHYCGLQLASRVDHTNPEKKEVCALKE